MAKRKKRLLFDVLDDVVRAGSTRRVGPARVPTKKRAAAARTASAPRDGGPPEIRITRDMGITIVVVVVAFIGCAYYSGMVHGRNSESTPESVSLRRDGGGADVDRSAFGDHFAIQACIANYNTYTVAALGESMQDLQAFLEDAGYSHIDVYDYPHKTEEGRGTLVMWVGRAERRVDLEADATVLRSLRVDDTHPFATAFVRLFTD